MKAVVGDVIGTTDGRYGTVVCDKGTLLVESIVALDLEPYESMAGEVFEITQAEVASIR